MKQIVGVAAKLLLFGQYPVWDSAILFLRDISQTWQINVRVHDLCFIWQIFVSSQIIDHDGSQRSAHFLQFSMNLDPCLEFFDKQW